MPVWKKVVHGIVLLALFAAAFAALTIPLDQQTSDRTDTLDFANYYMGGRIVRQGHSLRLYNLALQQQIEREVSPGGPFQPFLHPPFEALFFAPFTLLSYPHAFLLWAATNLLVLGLIIYLLRFTGCRLGTVGYAVWMGICLFFVLVTLALGLDTLLLALVFLLAFLALKRRRDFAAGLVLGLGLFRFQILLPFVFILFLRRRWKLLAGFCAMAVAELLASVALVRWTGLVRYLQTLVEVGGAATGSWSDRSSASMMPCLRGMCDTLLGGVLPHSSLFLVILAGTLVLLGWAAWKFKSIDRPADPSFDLEFSLASIAALLASYHVFIGELAPIIVASLLILAYEATRPHEGILWNRRGTALLLLIFAVVAGGAVVHSQAFSVEVIVMLGLMVWLSREITALRSPAAPN